MNPRPISYVLIVIAALFPALHVFAQIPPPADPPISSSVPTLHVETPLTLVDVIAEHPSGKLHGRELIGGLKQADFRLFDDDHEVAIHSLGVASDAEHTVRPIALWIVVHCNMGGPIGYASAYMRGKTHWLIPGLSALQPMDVVGVAHWCDNGEVKLDALPSADKALALATVETILKAPAVDGQSRQGELALQKLFYDALAATGSMPSKHLPVFLFLYGDHSATYRTEAENIIGSLLRSSGLVFGLTEQGSETNLSEDLGAAGQVSHLIHHYASETGGQYLSASRPELLASALAYMLAEVHHRYVVGFKPPKLDGKHHSLRVELTKDARKMNADPELRFRDQYIPTKHSVEE